MEKDLNIKRDELINLNENIFVIAKFMTSGPVPSEFEMMDLNDFVFDMGAAIQRECKEIKKNYRLPG